MRATLPSRFSTRKRQRGVATILIVLFAGFSLSAAVLGVMYRIRGSQEQAVALHAQTQAQIRAWTGAEIVRQYLDGLQQRGELDGLVTKLNTANSETGVKPTNVPITLQQADGTALSGIQAKFTKVDVSGAAPAIWAAITGITEESGKAEARATLEVVYSLETSTTESTVPGATACAASPKAVMVFNGDVNYSGGSMQIVNSNNALTNVAISGNLTVGSASTAMTSGCSKNDISLTGGGIANGATLYSEGNITISNMSQPSAVTLWAKNLYVNQNGGSYTALQAGAFTANVVDSHGAVVGTAVTGGTILSTNYILPPAGNTIVVTLSDGTRYAVPLGSATISSAGLVTPLATDVVRLSGSGTLPASFSLSHTGVTGGTLNYAGGTAGTMWGNEVSITGWGGTYTDVMSHGMFQVITGTIGKLTGGGDAWATQAGYSQYSNYNFPTINGGNIAGHLYASSSKTLVPDNATVAGITLNRSRAGTDPGLPGLPYCDTTVQAIDTDDYKDGANYIFYFDGNTPMLKVQNVKRGDNNESIDGTYNLATTDLRTLGGFDFMQCSWYNSHCLRSSTPANGWSLDGVYKFPAGVLWFDGKVQINGVNSGTQANLYNALLATGNVTLTSSGHVPLYAPNYATVSQTCGGSFYPSNLCTRSGSTFNFATWTDAGGTTHTGLPIGNTAIMTEGALSSSGWEIHGNVLLGRGITLEGATTTIFGTLTVGANATSTTTISQGGLKVVTSGLSSDQLYQPGTGCTSSSATEETSSSHIRILWSRYQ